eukprot:scaffold106_cov123-Cylindrotheca_fusiformis.AAC.15
MSYKVNCWVESFSRQPQCDLLTTSDAEIEIGGQIDESKNLLALRDSSSDIHTVVLRSASYYC